MQENHHKHNGFSLSGQSAAGNHVQLLPSWQENQTLQLPQAEINPFYPNIDIYSNLPHVKPSFPDDFPLESEFSRLNLSTPCHPFPSGGSNLENNSVVDLPIGMGFTPDPYGHAHQLPNGELQRMRVQSAARGQMGLYVQPQNYSLGDEGLDAISYLNSRATFDYDLNNLYNGGLNLSGATIRYPSHLPYEMGYENQSYLNRNGFKLDTSKFEDKGANNSSIFVSQFRQNFSSLENLRGKIFLVAKDQYGCRFLQKKFEGGNPEEIQFIFSEVKDYVRELMVDQFGNYLMQKFFEICNEQQMNQILLLVISDERSLLAICLDMHGTRAMQKLLEHLTTPEQRSLVISVFRRITVTLTKSINGHHVIQHCLKFFSTQDNKHILNVVADNCLGIATDKSGCCVLQQCVAHANGKPWERLVGEITANALVLSEHPYGNYVVQYILGLKIPQVTAKILEQLAGAYASLSMNKYGSNVVEKCLKESEEHLALEIVNEIIRSPNFLMVLQDPYGNYVAQSAMAISKGAIRHAMIHLIHIHYELLHSHPHGKRVLARIRGRKQRV
ncbi:Pumilio12 [Abeliophyllum distichum]|uniref:Pumilio12 n=1 Tax=Abeliophyllum distichum TaxID=126358 RepID=A0ABD1THX6_9LAMI